MPAPACRVRTLLVVACAAMVLPLRAQDLWLMKGHDVRRTGQSASNGPLAVDPVRSWATPLPAAYEVNVGATVTPDGVFFGSWGVQRRDTLGRGPTFWDKSDGKLYGLDAATGAFRWGGPLDLDLTPRCYDYEDRGPNLLWCGLGPYEVSYYNGTVEGQPAADTARGVLYVGRGDGKLYAVDPAAGRIRWRYVTYNPARPSDPDGGGEVVSSPLVGPDGTVYFGTWGEGPYETNAFYAVGPDSLLRWRYPAAASLAHRIFASPALSPDGAAVYVSTFLADDTSLPAALYAFHRDPAGPAPDADRLRWKLDLVFDGRPVWTTTLAVGADGTVYVGGFFLDGSTHVPVLVAVRDTPDGPVFAWAPAFRPLRDGAQLVLGVALRETGGQTRRLYVTTANLGTPLFNGKEEGSLYAVAPADGAVLASYDPSDDVPEAVGSLNSPAIGADGVVYFGVRGKYAGPGVSEAVDGHYFGVAYDPEAGRFTRLWSHRVDGHVEWNHPALGPNGGLYGGTSVGNSGSTTVYDPGEVPPNTTPTFYGLKGPTRPVHAGATPEVPAAPRLSAPYPNPFAAAVSLVLDLPAPGPVAVRVVDLLGRTLRMLAAGEYAAGPHVLVWDGFDSAGQPTPAGAYFIHTRTGSGWVVVRPVVRLGANR